MLQALAEHGITPDLLVGTSAGALNAAYIAGTGHTSESANQLGSIWRHLHARTLFPIDPRRALSAVLGRANAICSDRGLRTLLDRYLAFDNLEDATIPCVVVAANLLTGQEVAMKEGNARAAVLASCAIPGILPPVWHNNQPLADGALANNTALSQAVDIGADTIYVLPSGYSCALPTPPRTPLGAAVHAMAILTHQRLIADIARYATRTRLIVLPPPCPIRISPANFAKADKLIAAGYEAAVQALNRPRATGMNAAEQIGFHGHPEPPALVHYER